MVMRRNFLWILMLLCQSLAALAQPLPVDSLYHTGRLPNGLTYYIVHNSQTPHVADFYIAQRVGSILEEPRQRGLAHFLEHMAFNGSKHFPGGDNTIVKWCERNGIKFGANLNAYTSVDETVYNISAAPVARAGVVDTCLLILSDWSHDLNLSGDEIDKERGVIREEWRTRRAGMAVQRLMEDAMPVVYAGSKYADCMPIGNIDIINNFPYNDLRDYYHKWYRPDLQAIIVVGDIDVKDIERKIKATFSAIPAPVNPAPRVYYPVPDNPQMIVFAKQDKEQPTVNFSLYMKRDATPRAQRNTVAEYRADYLGHLVTRMLNDRLDDITQRPNPPFVSASVRDGGFFLASTKDAFTGFAMCNPDSVEKGIGALVGEMERVRQHGFTEAELQRAKKEWMRGIRNDYEERDKRRNSEFVRNCVGNFTDGANLLSPADELRLAEQLDRTVDLSEVNAAAATLITDSNQVVTLYGPEKDGFKLPSENDIGRTILAAQARSYDSYKEQSLPASLMPVRPKAGSIVSERPSKYGYTCFSLSNGMTVYARSTDFEADNISMKIFSNGGTSLYGVDDLPSLSYAASVVSSSGLADMPALTIEKMLAGKTVSAAPYISGEEEGINASCGKADMETMFQLANLYFTSPRRDEDVFKSIMDRQRTFLANRDASPMVSYRDSLTGILYGNNPRLAPIKEETLGRVSLDRIMEIYRERFADASDFNVVITGSVDFDKLRPLLCTYLASLPALHHREEARDNNVRIRPTKEVHCFTKPQEVPASTTNIFATAPLEVTADNDMKLDVLSQILRIQYTEKVREEKGGTYGVSVSSSLDDFPVPLALLRISFRTDPSKYSGLIPVVYKVLDDMAQNGPDQADLDKIKEYEEKTYGQVRIMNDYWQQMMYDYVSKHIDYDTDYVKRIRKLTTNDIQAIARKLVAANRCIEITMLSEKK